MMRWWTVFGREKEEDDALELARIQQQEEVAKQDQKRKIERMREAERRRREAVSASKITTGFYKTVFWHASFLFQQMGGRIDMNQQSDIMAEFEGTM